MKRRPSAHIAALVCSCLAGLSVPALGWASSGGAGLGSGSGSGAGAVAQPADSAVSASADGITLSTQESAFLADQVSFSGSAPAADSGQQVEIDRSGHQTRWRWTPTAFATVAPDGTFSVTWHANHIGRFAVRALLRQAPGGHAAADWPRVTVTVYRPSLATQYGPGFWGRRTACGETLRRRTIGVANRRLPCGTKVAIYYGGRMLVVPVIDRGPYANGADWDLTEATGRALGIAGTARIGAVSLPRPR